MISTLVGNLQQLEDLKRWIITFRQRVAVTADNREVWEFSMLRSIDENTKLEKKGKKERELLCDINIVRPRLQPRLQPPCVTPTVVTWQRPIRFVTLKLFAIFVQPSKMLQGEKYPMMNYVIPQYL